jgi:hypothetical protein
VEAGFFVVSRQTESRKEISPQTGWAAADQAMRFFAITDVISFFGLSHLNSD